jgi:hypothetical protein
MKSTRPPSLTSHAGHPGGLFSIADVLNLINRQRLCDNAVAFLESVKFFHCKCARALLLSQGIYILDHVPVSEETEKDGWAFLVEVLEAMATRETCPRALRLIRRYRAVFKPIQLRAQGRYCQLLKSRMV